MIYIRDAEIIRNYVCLQFFLLILFCSLSHNLTKLAICIFACVSVGLKEACFLRMNRNENGHAVVMIKSARLNEV